MNIEVGKKAIAEATEKLKNWGRWGKDDQIGTLNYVTPENIVRAAGLIRTGKVFALGIPLDRHGPQTGLFGGRWNPIHTMLATGTDAVAGRHDKVPNIRYADDAIAAQGAEQRLTVGEEAQKLHARSIGCGLRSAAIPARTMRR